MPPTEARQYEQICRERFDQQYEQGREILELLRGKGDSPGLVALLSRHDEHIKDLRVTLYGEKSGEGLAFQVQGLSMNGLSRKTDEQERRAFVRAVICKLMTAGIIALAALLLGLYKSQPAPPPSEPEPIVNSQ